MPDPRPILNRTAAWLLPAAAFAALAWRQLRFIDRQVVNVLFFDQWGFYYPLFHAQSWWETFDRRHGPHRQGIGLVVTRLLAPLTGWNSRGDAFALSAVLILSALLALLLLRRCESRAGFAAALAVPVLFFNAHQFEVFVGATNLSHGAMPVLMLLLFSLACFIRSPGLRLSVLSILTFNLVFTGFGAFAGMVAPVLFAAEAVQAFRAGDRRRAAYAGLALAGVGATWFLFFRGYVFDPAAADFRFPYEKPLQYPVFVARMLAHFYGLSASGLAPILVGFGLVLALLATCLRHGWTVLRRGVGEHPRSAALFFLAAYEIAFCASDAVGRVMGGDSAPLASRYVTLVIPAALLIVLELSALSRPKAAFWACLAFAAAAAPGCLSLSPREQADAAWYHNTRANWKAAYLRTHDQKAADNEAHFGMYPESIAFELSFLERNHYNLFQPGPGP